MTQPVRVGVIGTSWWADTFHLPGLKSHARADLAAICGRNRDRAGEMAKKYSIPLIFTDYREMIEKADLHAVVVAVPDDLHHPMTMAALDAGLHVLCEKPLALNVRQAREMYDKAEAKHVKHMVYFTYRWLPNYRYVRRLLDQGYLGRCLHCNIRYLAGYGRHGQYRWRFDRQRSNGALGDLGSHMIDLARWYVGDIAQVCAQLSTFVERPGPDGQPLDPANDAAAVVMRFANGAQGMVQISTVAQMGERGQEQHVVLHGEEGTLEITNTFAGGEIRGVHQGEKEFHSLPVPDELGGDADRSKVLDLFCTQPIGDRMFIDAILDDRPVAPSFFDGLKEQEVIEAAIVSHEKGCWVAV